MAARRNHATGETMQTLGKTIGLVGVAGVLGLGAIALAAQLAQAQTVPSPDPTPVIERAPASERAGPLRALPRTDLSRRAPLGRGSGSPPSVRDGAKPGPFRPTVPARPENPARPHPPHAPDMPDDPRQALRPSAPIPAGQTLTLDFRGPMTGEFVASPHPFLDYRLQVVFTSPSGRVYEVPGYFAGDGATGVTPETAVAPDGDVWRVRFTPDEQGLWSWNADFRVGDGVAIELARDAGEPWAPFAGANPGGISGAFEATDPDPDAPGFLKWGRLRAVNEHYLKFDFGPRFIKTGADSPENWLGYYGFDNTFSANDRGPNTPDRLHRYPAHADDWRAGDPDWDSPDTPETNDGRAIIGAINYLADAGVNSIYFLPMNIGGDAQDTWPYADPAINGAGDPNNDNTRFDLSKLNQWEIVFDHAQRRGVMLHIVLNEAEGPNKNELDNATLGPERKLFYRELVARFGHHNALVWNISEEYNLSLNLGAARVLEFASWLKAVDPYDHPVTVHNAGNPTSPMSGPWAPFIGRDEIDLTSLQWARQLDGLGEVVQAYRAASAAAGKPIPVMIDEPGSPTRDAGNDLDAFRQRVVYDILFSGGGGEWFINNLDQSLEDFREFDKLWREAGYARRFMEENLPFWEMEPADALVVFETARYGGAEVLAKPGVVYAIYLPDASGPSGSDTAGLLNVGGFEGAYEVRWFDPRTGAFAGDFVEVDGSFGAVSLGEPPSHQDQDWVALVRRVDLEDCDGDGIVDCRCAADIAGATETDPDGVVDQSDFTRFLALWSAGDPQADITNMHACDRTQRDGMVTLADFSCYLVLWARGCD